MGVLQREGARATPDGPTVAVLYYRAQQLAGNIAYVDALCTAIEDHGGNALPVYCASLRTAPPELLETLAAADAMVVTVLAAGGAIPAAVGAGEPMMNGAWLILRLLISRSCRDCV